MAEFLSQVLRTNSVLESLTTLQNARRGAVAAIPPAPGFTTLANGQVVDSAGKVIYTPTPIKQG